MLIIQEKLFQTIFYSGYYNYLPFYQFQFNKVNKQQQQQQNEKFICLEKLLNLSPTALKKE